MRNICWWRFEQDPKYERSSPDPKLPLLVITNTTFEDIIYYRLPKFEIYAA